MKATAATGSGLKMLGITEGVLFCLAWMGFGVFAFFQIDAWGREYDRKMNLISSGQVPAETLSVVSLQRKKDSNSWSVKLRSGATTQPIYRESNNLDHLAVGTHVEGYKFDKGYLIPRFDTGGHHWGKWVFLAFGIIPPAIFVGGTALVRSVRRRRSQQYNPVNPAPPKAFAVDRIQFDTEPTDEQLLSLIGSEDQPEALDIDLKDTDGVLSARPRLIPMKFIVPWMIFIACVITALPWIVPRFGGHFSGAMAWIMIVVMWLFVLPTMFKVLHSINAYISKQKDYFRVEERSRTLELPRLGMTVEGRQIECFTEIDRWYRSGGGWSRVRQTGVLVRTDQGFEHLAVIHGQRGFRKPVVDQLGRTFDVSVRRVKLGLRQSRALRDSV